jgi:hypothetical protein
MNARDGSRKVVDLPQPEGPSSTTKVPASAVKLTWSTAGSAPQRLVTPSSRTCATQEPFSQCAHYVARMDSREGGRKSAIASPTAIDRIVTASTIPPSTALDQFDEEDAIPALLETGESAMNTMKKLTVLAIAISALAVTVGSAQAGTRGGHFGGGHFGGGFHRSGGHGPAMGMNKRISCFACNLPRGGHDGYRGYRPGRYGWGYGTRYWGYKTYGYGYGNPWRYSYGSGWYRWYPWFHRPVVYSAVVAPVVATPAVYAPAPVAEAPVAAPVAEAPVAPVAEAPVPAPVAAPGVAVTCSAVPGAAMTCSAVAPPAIEAH